MSGQLTAALVDGERLTASCEECGRVVYVLADWFAQRRSIAPEHDDAVMVATALRESGWVLRDENDQPVRVCDRCVEQLKAARAATTCPSWCTVDHGEEVVRDEWVFVHKGPDFGNVFVRRLSRPGSALGVDVFDVEDIYVGDQKDLAAAVAQLRQLAADASAAAEWMESTAGLWDARERTPESFALLTGRDARSPAL